ncbi:MAG: hypothetical protein WD740_02260 [Anaerolineales bacterium]
MSFMTRYTLFGITILLGFLLAVYYGWAVRPVSFDSATPAMLRQDFQADYVLMVAEAFQADNNVERSIAALAFLGVEGQSYNPYIFASDTLAFGTLNGYAVPDLERLQILQQALLEFDASFAPTPTP